jgi:hypothetical protein
MVNYENSKIYKLINNVDDKIYIGSTVSRLSKRKSKHHEEFIKYPDRKVYKHLNQVGWGNVDIVLIEKYPCKDKEELHARERFFIEELKAELNNRKPIQTKEERKEYLRMKDKERYNNPNGLRKEYCRKLQKEQYEKNKDKYKVRDKAYYEKNKEAIKLQKRTKTKCICGSMLSNSNMSEHKKTKKHLKYIENQNN